MIIRTRALVMSKLREALGMGSPEFVSLNEDDLEGQWRTRADLDVVARARVSTSS
jgi:hypothetical protein